MPKHCIYSVISNDYDTVKPITVSNIPHILFTDNPDINAKGWQVVPIEKTDCQRLQRKIKILGHEALNDYDVTIYIDASITLKRNFIQLIRQYRGGLMIGKHLRRNCVYAEGLEIKKQGKAPEELVNKHIAEYYKNNFPVNFGMWSSGFMIRDKSTKEMCEIWHEELSKHTHRDQLSLPLAIYKTKIKPVEVNLNHYMTISQHKKKEPPKFRTIQPWRTDKNIGKANNDEIADLPDDCWIVLTDGDSCWVRPDWGKCIEEVIKEHGDEYALIGCVTNRLGGLHQCYNNEFDNEVSGYKSFENANEAWEKHGTKVEPTTGVAGVCMIFKKSTWKKVGGFKENTIKADTEFNKSVKRIGGKIGIAKGLYRFHFYRIWETEHKKAWHSVEHLK